MYKPDYIFQVPEIIDILVEKRHLPKILLYILAVASLSAICLVLYLQTVVIPKVLSYLGYHSKAPIEFDWLHYKLQLKRLLRDLQHHSAQSLARLR